LARITKAILDDENAVLPLSVFQEGQYGVENVFIGQPAIVGAHGIVRPVNIPLNDAETQKMQASAKELQAIIDEARRESIKWDKKMIPSYQKQLGNGNLTGEDRILVRARLLQTAAQLAIFEMEYKVKHVKTLLSDAKESVQKIINDARTEAFGLATYLSDSEVESLLIDFDIKHYWEIRLKQIQTHPQKDS